MNKKFDILYGLTVLIACVIPFNVPGSYSALPVIALLLSVHRHLTEKTAVPGNTIQASALFLVYLAWSIPVSIRTGSLSFLETALPFLAFPFLATSAKLTEIRLRRILLSYIAAVIISYLASLAAAIYHFRYTPPRWGRATDFFFHVQFTEGLFDIHPTYYSLMGCIAALFAFFYLTGWRRAVVILLLTVFIFMINARITIVIHTIILLFFGTRALYQRLHWRAIVVVVVAASGLYVLSGFFSTIYDYPHRKITMNIDTALTRSKEPDISDADGGLVIRLAIWRNAIAVIRDNLWLGHGWPTEKSVLKQRAVIDEAPSFLVDNARDFNSHNQVLSFIVSFGVVGLFLILLYFLAVIRQMILTRNWLALSFLCVFFMSSLTESVLERLWGIILFSFFNSVLLLKTHDQRHE